MPATEGKPDRLSLTDLLTRIAWKRLEDTRYPHIVRFVPQAVEEGLASNVGMVKTIVASALSIAVNETLNRAAELAGHDMTGYEVDPEARDEAHEVLRAIIPVTAEGIQSEPAQGVHG